MNKKLILKKYISALAGILVLVAVDQYTKLLAVRHLKDQKPLVILDGVFELQYLENRGAAFGMLQDRRYFFVIMTVMVFVAVAYFYGITPASRRYLPLRLCMIVVTAGAVGNFIDRIVNGYVVDFFYISVINFPIFNVADIYVTVTFLALILLIFFYYGEEDFAIYSRKYRKEHCAGKHDNIS